VVLFIMSLVLSVTNVATVLSAPAAAPLSAVAAPDKIGFEGYATDAFGAPVADGAHTIVFKLYSVPTGGSVLWSQTLTPTTVGGYYSVLLGPISAGVWDSGVEYIGVTIDGGSEVSPRTRMTAVPFALYAQNVPWSGISSIPAGFADGVDDTVSVGNVVTGTGTAGQVAVWNTSTSIKAMTTLTLTGGLNLGAATGAGTGEIKASGAIRESTAIGARVYNNAALSINNSTLTVLTFNSERWDTDTIHSTGSSTSRLTCKTAGRYLISVTVEWANNATGRRGVNLRLNGATVIAVNNETPLSTGATGMNTTTVYDLAVNDYVEVQVFQDSGGSLNINAGGNYSPEFMMVRIP
jgi:hypothetical protein